MGNQRKSQTDLHITNCARVSDLEIVSVTSRHDEPKRSISLNMVIVYSLLHLVPFN